MPPPPFALIADLHANLEATEAVLADIDAQGLKEIVCLGDIVGYGPDPDKVVDLVRTRVKTVIAGNHDWAVINKAMGFNTAARDVIEYTRDMMEPKFYQLFGKTRERWHFLESLPDLIEQDGLQFVHGSLRERLMEYTFGDRHRLYNPGQLDDLFTRVQKICFYGHTHFPVVIRDDKKCWYPFEPDTAFSPEPGRKYLCNVGSVGQPRDGDPRSCYAIYDGKTISYRRVVYDVETTRTKILAIDSMEQYLADRLRTGK
jgi:predicted phosphodiesterase